MDAMQVLVIAIVVLGVAMLALAIGFFVNVRMQQRSVHQAARRAVEEVRRNGLQLPDLRPKSARKPRPVEEAEEGQGPEPRKPRKPRAAQSRRQEHQAAAAAPEPPAARLPAADEALLASFSGGFAFFHGEIRLHKHTS